MAWSIEAYRAGRRALYSQFSTPELEQRAHEFPSLINRARGRATSAKFSERVRANWSITEQEHRVASEVVKELLAERAKAEVKQ